MCWYTFSVVTTSEWPKISETTFVGHFFNERVASVCRKSCHPPSFIPSSCTVGRTYLFSAFPGLIGLPARDRNTHSPSPRVFILARSDAGIGRLRAEVAFFMEPLLPS